MGKRKRKNRQRMAHIEKIKKTRRLEMAVEAISYAMVDTNITF